MSASKWKPYPEYKSTNDPWIPSIPLHWETKPLQFVFEEKKKPNKAENEKNVLSLSYGKIIRKDVSKNLGLLPASFDTYNIVEPESIILRLTDLQNDKKSLRVGLVKERGIITSAYLCIKSNTSSMNKYGYLLLHAFDLTKIFYAIGDGVRQSMGYEQMRKLGIAIPNENEREKIIQFCGNIDSTIDALIESVRKKVALLKEKRSAIISRVVTKGLNLDVSMKNSGIDWIGLTPTHWEIKMAKHVFTLQRGEDLSSDQFVMGEYPVCSSNSVMGYHNQSNAKGPSVVVGRSGSVGAVNFVETDFFAHNTALYVKRFEGVLPKFVYFFLLAMNLPSFAAGSAVGTLNRNHIHRQYIAIPSLEEQQEIVTYIENHDETIQRMQEKLVIEIESLKEYQTALISAAVTGKIDVRSL